MEQEELLAKAKQFVKANSRNIISFAVGATLQAGALGFAYYYGKSKGSLDLHIDLKMRDAILHHDHFHIR